MTSIFLIRHAEPDHGFLDDPPRPLTLEGVADAKKLVSVLGDLGIDAFYSSPYLRSIDTIKPLASHFAKPIVLDERFRERKAGPKANNREMFEKRWADFGFHEEGGESIGEVQSRNIAALADVLKKEDGNRVAIGHHGTALSSILNFYDPSFLIKDFLRILNFMPYVIELRFNGPSLVSRNEIFYIEKKY